MTTTVTLRSPQSTNGSLEFAFGRCRIGKKVITEATDQLTKNDIHDRQWLGTD